MVADENIFAADGRRRRWIRDLAKILDSLEVKDSCCSSAS